jgi:hypothetical protein
MRSVERWGRFELELGGNSGGENPYLDSPFEAAFIHEESGTATLAAGFCDGEGVFRLRFMPERLGRYSYRTSSRHRSLDGVEGGFECVPAGKDNHGPVRVAKRFHFSYADGKPCFVMGSTAYAWTCRPREVRAQTLASLSAYGFNKVRMLFFPKRYIGSFGDVDISYEPPEYPFPGEPGAFDFTRFNPSYFRNFEERVQDLMDRGVEADVILFHPYDSDRHWGIDSGMNHADQIRYLRYLMGRLSAYRNVWWSLANEYDVTTDSGGRTVITPEAKDWDGLGEFVRANDPFGHPISIHNIPFGWIYPDRPWLSHVSYQHPDTYTLLLELKARYGKPVVDDEYQYEGNIRDNWGNSDAETTVERHWRSAMASGYASHGEVFASPENRRDIFWAYGGTLRGQSPERLAFMKSIFEDLPFQDMERDALNTDGQNYFSLHKGMDLYLSFFRRGLTGKDIWYGPRDGTEARYSATIWDVWNCREIGRLEVGLRHRFEVGDWTAIRLVRLE